MEQLNLAVTQSMIAERHAHTVRAAEHRRLARERAAWKAARTTTTVTIAPARPSLVARLAERLHLGAERLHLVHHRPAMMTSDGAVTPPR